MSFAGGDPVALDDAARRLDTAVADLSGDAVHIKAQGRSAAGAAGDAEVGDVAETVLAGLGGAVVATATVVAGLAEGARTSADQLETATGAAR